MNPDGRLHPIITIFIGQVVCVLYNHGLDIKPATVRSWESTMNKGKMKEGNT